MAFKTFDPEIAARKQKNADIFRETTRLIKAGGYTTPSGKQIQFDFTRMLQQGKCFQQEIPAVSASLVEGGTKVIVECNDCLVAAGRLVNEGYNPVQDRTLIVAKQRNGPIGDVKVRFFSNYTKFENAADDDQE